MMSLVRALPTYDETTALPGTPPTEVSPAVVDANGHMNVRHYLATLDDAEWVLLEQVGLDAAGSTGGNVFALEQHLTYRREVTAGQQVSVHLRILGRDHRMVHLVSYLVVHDAQEVAASLESLDAYVDHTTRRMSPFPVEVAAGLDRWIADHRALPWTPELSGALALPEPR